MTLDEILIEAIEQKASDIHVTSGLPVMFRVDGALVPSSTPKMTPPLINELATPLYRSDDRLLAEMSSEGQIDFAYSIVGKGRFRVNIFRQRGSLAMVMRLLPFTIPTPEDLGIPQSVVDMCERKRGLVLVTGATGSGKSTTLASLVNVINSRYSRHIITVEDPIEYLHRHNKSIVNQRELGNDTKDFAGALRAALREDPDVILVGEMRDLETIATAITAAETGHLVFSTLHTNSAASTIDRVIDVFPPYQQQQIRTQLANVIECVVSQQLLKLSSGHGRAAAFEVMIANAAIRNLIREGKSFQIPSTIQTNKKAGMQSMDDALFDLFIQRKITAEDCVSYAQDIPSMRRKVML